MKRQSETCDTQAIIADIRSIIKSLAVMFTRLENFEIDGESLRGIGVILEGIVGQLDQIEAFLDSVTTL